MDGIPEVEDEAAYSMEEDEAWNTEVQLIIKPHQGLTQAQKGVIEKDYSMEKGELVVTTRGALVEYMLQILHIDKQTDKRPAVQQQVELANFNDVKRWCFGG
jgi:hypothetical protein